MRPHFNSTESHRVHGQNTDKTRTGVDPLEVFAAVAGVAERAGETPINQRAGTWERQLDPAWWIAVNAHRDPVTCSKGVEVAPFTMYVEYNGWPAGILSPTAGGQFAAGTGANIETFLAACERA